LDCSSTRSSKTSASRRSSSAIIGGWLEIIKTTVALILDDHRSFSRRL
jgi:hypothetical protein